MLDEAEFERRLDEIAELCRGMSEDQLTAVAESVCDFPAASEDDS